MSDGLFDLDPAALIYRGEYPPAMHASRCRECHKTGSMNGGGSCPASLDETGGGGYQYAICERCFRAPGRTGELARE